MGRFPVSGLATAGRLVERGDQAQSDLEEPRRVSTRARSSSDTAACPRHVLPTPLSRLPQDTASGSFLLTAGGVVKVMLDNNRLEADHGQLKRLIRPTLGFQSMRSAWATFAGFELMRMFRKGQFRFWIEAIGGGTLGGPMLERPAEGTEVHEYIRTAYQDIPLVIPAIPSSGSRSTSPRRVVNPDAT